MYYKIILDLHDKMRVYKEEKHPDSVVERKELRTPWSRDYFTVENGKIKLISGRRDETEYDGAKVEYPKGTKEICLFIENNKDALLPMSEELFEKDYNLNRQRNGLLGELMGMDMTIEDYRSRMGNPPTLQEKKIMNRLWNERDKLVRQIGKLDKKEKLLLSGKVKKKQKSIER